MTGGGRFLAATAAVSAIAALAGTTVPVEWRPGWWLALGITLVIQVPLGWRLVASLGTESFFGFWVLGILARLVTIGVVGLLILPALGWALAPALLALVGFFVVSLAIEGAVSARQSRRVEG